MEKDFKCPITSISFELSSSLNSTTNTVRVSDYYSLTFSKESSDNLPITTTQIAYSTPCLIPDEFSIPDEILARMPFYPTELDRHQ